MTDKAALILTLIYGLILAQIGGELNLLFLGILLLLTVWNLLIAIKGLKRPGSMIINLMALACLAVLFISVGVRDTVQLFVAMLLLGCLFKLLQLGSEKDQNQLMVLTFFSITLVFIYRQSLPYALMCTGLYCLNLGLLAAGNSRIGDRAGILLAGKTLMLAFPVATLLLIFMPHLPSFWSLPGPGVSKTGLNERIDPFSISELTQSDELAFRVEFENQIPPGPLYWRAIIHDYYDGSAWQVSRRFDALTSVEQAITPEFTNTAEGYKIIAEKANHLHLYGLDYAKSASKGVISLNRGLVERRKNNGGRLEYQAYSQPLSWADKTLTANEFRQYTRVPPEGNTQSRELAYMLKRDHSDNEKLVTALLNYFKQKRFRYTLKPPKSDGPDQIDQFMFENRSGFCGHYASSMAFILRAAGVPARVVSGYLGGKPHAELGYYSVHQYDAHAWVEYWAPGTGWHRADATGVVLPERLDRSLSEISAMEEEFMSNLDFGLARFERIPGMAWLKNTIEMIDYNWARWVLGYNSERQRGLFSRWFGSASLSTGAIVAISCAALLLAVYFFYIARKNRAVNGDALNKQFYRLCKAASDVGIDFTPGTTPTEYCALLSKKYPERACLFDGFISLYSRVRYQSQPLDKQKSKQAKDLVNEIIKTIKRSQ